MINKKEKKTAFSFSRFFPPLKGTELKRPMDIHYGSFNPLYVNITTNVQHVYRESRVGGGLYERNHDILCVKTGHAGGGCIYIQ